MVDPDGTEMVITEVMTNDKENKKAVAFTHLNSGIQIILVVPNDEDEDKMGDALSFMINRFPDFIKDVTAKMLALEEES